MGQVGQPGTTRPRLRDRFPWIADPGPPAQGKDFTFELSKEAKAEVVADCDHSPVEALTVLAPHSSRQIDHTRSPGRLEPGQAAGAGGGVGEGDQVAAEDLGAVAAGDGVADHQAHRGAEDHIREVMFPIV